MLKTYQKRRPTHRRLLHPSSRRFLRRTTPLPTKNPVIQTTGKPKIPRLLLFETSFVLLSRGKDLKVTPPTRTDKFSHLLANIDSPRPMDCLRTHNGRCTF